MIKFLIFKRYNVIDLAGQGLAIWLATKYDNNWWLMLVLAFSFVAALCDSIDRLRNNF
jgi:hypothetical protein